MSDAMEVINVVPQDSSESIKRYEAETDRLRVLIKFLRQPLYACGGKKADEDILTAYNLAIEAALHNVRKAAQQSSI